MIINEHLHCSKPANQTKPISVLNNSLKPAYDETNLSLSLSMQSENIMVH